MKFKPLMTLISLLVFLAAISCKKSQTTGNNNSSNKLKLYIEDGSRSSYNAVDTFTVSYDGDSRITALVSPNLKFVYTYATNSFNVDLYEFNQLSVHEIDFINSSSFVDSSFQYNNTNDSTTEKYVYSGNMLTKKREYIYSKITGSQIDLEDDYTYDNSGNMIQDILSDSNGNVNSVSAFTYGTAPVNVVAGPIYFPVLSKYLPLTQTQKDGSGNLIASVTYTYTFDSKGRLTQETDTLNDGEIAIKKYVYIN
jgi:YD repeat-containing protein